MASASSSCHPHRITSGWVKATRDRTPAGWARTARWGLPPKRCSPGGDTGPNTGGMGAYCPVGIATEALLARVRTEVFEPVLREVAAQGTPYEGVLYAGLMILPDDTPSVLEFNARFGDPEAQALLPALLPGFSEHLTAIAQRRWNPVATQHVLAVERAAVSTVLAARGYPDNPEKGVAIRLPDPKDLGDDVIVFHAGTYRDNEGRLRTAGGRVKHDHV